MHYGGKCFFSVKGAGRSFLPLIFLVSFLYSSTSVFSQDQAVVKEDTFDIKSGAFHLPVRTAFKDFRHMISVNQYFLPADWTLFTVNAPMINYTARYSLPAGFSVEGGISTLFVSNRFTFGPRWTYSKNNLHFGISYLWAYNLGVLNEFGFSVLVTGWSHLPSVYVGYGFKKTALTLKLGSESLGDFQYKTGDNIVRSSGEDYTKNGGFIGLTLEQRFKRNKVVSFGFGIYNVNFVMVAWPAFPINNKKYIVPEATIGFVLN